MRECPRHPPRCLEVSKTSHREMPVLNYLKWGRVNGIKQARQFELDRGWLMDDPLRGVVSCQAGSCAMLKALVGSKSWPMSGRSLRCC